MLKKSFLKISLFLFILSLSFSDTIFSQTYSHLDSLDGKFALQFQISDNFNLSDFQGTVLSGKYHFSIRDAVRLGFTLEFGDSDFETEITRLDTIKKDNSKDDYSSMNFGISAQYVRYLAVTNDVAFYLGAGPFIGIFNSSDERVINLDETEIVRKAEQDGYSLGLDFLTGVEWWFHKQMSLSAEYGIKFSYRYREDNFNDDVTKGESNIQSFYITDNNVKFGISVYF